MSYRSCGHHQGRRTSSEAKSDLIPSYQEITDELDQYLQDNEDDIDDLEDLEMIWG
jgi:hypothetical protein